MSEILLSHILPYIDTAPVNKSTSYQISNPFYWITKLDILGYFTDNHSVKQLSYKDVYIALKENDFNVNTAYIKACERGDVPVAQYLYLYVDSNMYEECVNKTNSSDIINTTYLNTNQVDRIILNSMGNTRKLEKILRIYSAVNIAPYVIGSLVISPESQALVASNLTRKELRKYIDNVNSRILALIYEEKGFTFNVVKAVDYGLPISVQKFLNTDPPQTTIRELLEQAITTKYIEVFSLLVSYAQFNMEYLLVVCSRKNLYKFCRIMSLNNVSVYKGILEGIKYGNNSTCEILLPFSQQKDLDTYIRLTKSLRNTELHNIILSYKQSLRK